MEATEGQFVLLLGIMLLAGYVAHVAGPRISIPRVTLLLIAGALAGPTALDLVPDWTTRWFPFAAHLALAMVGFLLGDSFAGQGIREKGPVVLWITVGETLFAAAFVFFALLIAGASLPLALVMAGIAPASAPAAILETVREGRSKGPLTDTLLGVVAIDDAWGVVLFSLLLVAAQNVSGGEADLTGLGEGLWEVFGAGLLGAALALPMIWITKRVREGEPTLIEAAGFVFLCSGVASLIHVSYLLSAMVMGALVARGSPHKRPFHALEKVREPFMAVFFILAGIEFDLDALVALGVVGAAYAAARALGLISGGWVSGRLAGASRDVKRRIGFCILPQAGVALGFALLVQEKLPEVGAKVLPLVIATTILFEIAGPVVARWELKRAGEWGQGKEEEEGEGG